MSAFGGLAAVSTALFMLISATVGLRLLWLARRTRALPEFALGFGLFIIVAVGYPLSLWARTHLDSHPDLARTLVAVSVVPMSLGFSAVWIFTWRVFRPASPLASALTLAALATMVGIAGGAIHHALTMPDIRALDYGDLRFVGTALMAMAAYIWAACESFRYYGAMKKRVALDLADPIVTNRFLLFGLVMCFSFVSTGIPACSSLLGVDTVRSPAVLASAAFTGVGCSASLWLAFVPPRAYLRSLRAA